MFSGHFVPPSAIFSEVEISIEDIILLGIVNARGKLSAIIETLSGHPFSIKKGNKFANGFVLSIEETHVVFRKTKEKYKITQAADFESVALFYL